VVISDYLAALGAGEAIIDAADPKNDEN